MTPDGRMVAYQRGLMAERIAAWYLRLKGYQILEKRYKTSVGEIDLIAKRGHLIAYIEVKARADVREARDSISERQRTRIGRAASMFLQSSPQYEKCDQRFDALLLTRRRLPIHIRDAWR